MTHKSPNGACLEVDPSTLSFAMDLAYETGSLMRSKFNPKGLSYETKMDLSLITAVDVAINDLIILRIKKRYPKHSILGDIINPPKDITDYVWVCDPIDGTQSYAMGVQLSAFSLALTYRGSVVLGVIYQPFTDQLFHAIVNRGAYLNGMPISVSKIDNIADSTCFFSYKSHHTFDISNTIKYLLNHDKRTYNYGSTAFSCCLIASGHNELDIFAGTQAYSIAAAKIIVTEAGGKVTDLFGNDQRYDRLLQGAIISNGLVHQQLIDLLKDTKRQHISD